MAASNVLFSLFVVISLNNVLTFTTDFPSPSNLPLATDLIDNCYISCYAKYANETNEIQFMDDTPLTNRHACEKGCRFYAITDALAESAHLDKSIEKSTCDKCCKDSYNYNELVTSCNVGCDLMKHTFDKNAASSTVFEIVEEQPYTFTSSFSIAIFIDDSSDTNEEQFGALTNVGDEDYIFIDPALRSQVSTKDVDSAKLPEVKVKTLPVESEKVSTVQSTSCWTWVSNVMEMKNVPPCLIAAVLILLIIMLVRFLFTCDFRSRNQILAFSRFGDDMEDPLAKSVFSSPGKSAPVTLIVDSEKNLVVPSSVSKVPPPKYEEAMLQPGDVIIKKSPMI